MAKRVAGARRPVREPVLPQGEPAPAVPDGTGSESTQGTQGTESTENIVVGRIGRPQGIKGEVTVEVRTDDPEDRFAPGRVLLTDPVERGPLTVATSRYQGNFLVVLFEGLSDRNGAEGLRDTLVLLPVADLPPLADEDEYYDTQLIGLAAELADGTVLGTVVDVLHLPHGDVLAVERVGGGPAELLVPFVKAIVPVVDLAGSRVVVDPPEGLLELSEPGEPGA